MLHKFHINLSTIENIHLFTIPLFLYLNYIEIAIFNIYYYTIYTIIYYFPNISFPFVKHLVRHHQFHLKNPKFNFGITTTWIDLIVDPMRKGI